MFQHLLAEKRRDENNQDRADSRNWSRGYSFFCSMFRTYLTMKIKDWSSTKSHTSGFGNIYVIGKINKERGDKCKRKNGKCEWGYSFHRHWFSTQQTCYRSYLLDLLRSTQTRNMIWIIPLVELRYLENSSSLKPPKYVTHPTDSMHGGRMEDKRRCFTLHSWPYSHQYGPGCESPDWLGPFCVYACFHESQIIGSVSVLQFSPTVQWDAGVRVTGDSKGQIY